MAKKPKLQNARVATELTEERPKVPAPIPLVMEERDELTAILNNPVFIKAWRNAELFRPSPFPHATEHFEGEYGDNRASKQLARIQGWEMHKAALIKQTVEVAPKPRQLPDEYSDAGSMEAEMKRKLKSTTQSK